MKQLRRHHPSTCLMKGMFGRDCSQCEAYHEKHRPAKVPGWAVLQKVLVGRKFRRRKCGRQETRLVVDVTLGSHVCFRYGPRLKYEGQISYSEWCQW